MFWLTLLEKLISIQQTIRMYVLTTDTACAAMHADKHAQMLKRHTHTDTQTPHEPDSHELHAHANTCMLHDSVVTPQVAPQQWCR